jgi:hypothetical protein
MKARVKATGEIVDGNAMVSFNGDDFYLDELEAIIDETEKIYDELDEVYWKNLEHQYAGMFLQAQISYGEQENLNAEEMVEDAVIYAHALVEKMKEQAGSSREE